MIIKQQNVDFADSASIDPIGRVFFFEQKTYRYINKAYENHINEIFSNGLISELIAKNLFVDSEISNMVFEDYNILIEHKKLINSTISDWSIDMIYDAAFCILSINGICNKYGYELKDAHTYNILFDQNKPKWIDLGSIVKMQSEKNWIAEKEFYKCLIFPLELYKKNEIYLFKKICQGTHFPSIFTEPIKDLEDTNIFIATADYVSINLSLRLKGKSFFSFKFTRSKFLKKRLANLSNRLFFSEKFFPSKNHLNKILSQLNLKVKDTRWGDYQTYYKAEKEHRFSQVKDLLKEHNIAFTDALDIAGNQGFFSQYLLEEGLAKNVINIDYDEEAISKGYQNSKGKSIHFILSNPFMEYHTKLLTKRFKSDIVFAMALTHHLILSQNLEINFIFEVIQKFTNKYIAIEFMPLGLWDGTQEVETPEFYTVDWFKDNFEKNFKYLCHKEIAPNRVLFLGEKL